MAAVTAPGETHLRIETRVSNARSKSKAKLPVRKPRQITRSELNTFTAETLSRMPS